VKKLKGVILSLFLLLLALSATAGLLWLIHYEWGVAFEDTHGFWEKLIGLFCFVVFATCLINIPIYIVCYSLWSATVDRIKKLIDYDDRPSYKVYTGVDDVNDYITKDSFSEMGMNDSYDDSKEYLLDGYEGNDDE
jgi:hypothetical protein